MASEEFILIPHISTKAKVYGGKWVWYKEDVSGTRSEHWLKI